MLEIIIFAAGYAACYFDVVGWAWKKITGAPK